MSAKAPRDQRDVWDCKDVAEHFGCSRPHVLKLAREGGLPHLTLGKLLRFKRADVLAWQDAKVKTQKKRGAA